MVTKHTVLILFDDDDFATLPWDEPDGLPEQKRMMAVFETVITDYLDAGNAWYVRCFLLTVQNDGTVLVQDIDKDDSFVPDDKRCPATYNDVKCWHRDEHECKHEHVGVTW